MITNTRFLEKPPFKKGDCVIDDNNQIGYVTADFTSMTHDANGKLTQWSTTIRYRWDQPSYGQERRVTDGEIEKWEPKTDDSKAVYLISQSLPDLLIRASEWIENQGSEPLNCTTWLGVNSFSPGKPVMRCWKMKLEMLDE